MAWTQSDLDAIDRAIASGELSVAYQDKRVLYRSMEELVQARGLIAGALDAASEAPRPSFRRFEHAGQGWE